MDIDFFEAEHREDEEVISYPVLAKWKTSGAVYLFTANTSGILVSDPGGLHSIGEVLEGDLVGLSSRPQDWEILPPGSSVTFLQE
jgi:hypothetical protein